MDRRISPSYTSKQLQSWTSFSHCHPVPQRWAQLGALHHLPKNADIRSSPHNKNDADTLDDFNKEDCITYEECSDLEIEDISLPKLKREIRRADLTGDRVFLCCMPRPAVPGDQMHSMQDKSDDAGLQPLRRMPPIQIHKQAGLYEQERAEFGELPPHPPGGDHQIRLDTEDNPPWVHPDKMDPSQSDGLQRQLDKLHGSGPIGPSSSPYAVGCLLVKKANGKWRMCVDYQALNGRTVRERYPLPLMKSILSTIGGSTIFSNIHLANGLHRTRIHHEDIEKTAFNTQVGAFKWVVMPFGLCNAPSTYECIVNDILSDHLGIFLWVYMDDIHIFSKNAEDHQRHLNLVHELLQQHQLFPCKDECMFFQPPVPFCGYIINEDGVHMDPEKIKVIRGLPVLTTIHEVRQLIGLCGFYQQFVHEFQAVAAPLTPMFKADFQ